MMASHGLELLIGGMLRRGLGNFFINFFFIFVSK